MCLYFIDQDLSITIDEFDSRSNVIKVHDRVKSGTEMHYAMRNSIMVCAASKLFTARYLYFVSHQKHPIDT